MVTLQQIIDAVHKLDEAKGFRILQVSEASEAELAVLEAEIKAAREGQEAEQANVAEDDAIQALKDLANEYTKEV